MRRRRSIATYLQYSEPDEATDKLLRDLRDSRTDRPRRVLVSRKRPVRRRLVMDEATDKLLRDLRDSRTDLGKLAERPHEPTADRIRNRQRDDGERRKLGSERR